MTKFADMKLVVLIFAASVALHVWAWASVPVEKNPDELAHVITILDRLNGENLNSLAGMHYENFQPAPYYQLCGLLVHDQISITSLRLISYALWVLIFWAVILAFRFQLSDFLLWPAALILGLTPTFVGLTSQISNSNLAIFLASAAFLMFIPAQTEGGAIMLESETLPPRSGGREGMGVRFPNLPGICALTSTLLFGLAAYVKLEAAPLIIVPAVATLVAWVYREPDRGYLSIGLFLALSLTAARLYGNWSTWDCLGSPVTATAANGPPWPNPLFGFAKCLEQTWFTVWVGIGPRCGVNGFAWLWTLAAGGLIVAAIRDRIQLSRLEWYSALAVISVYVSTLIFAYADHCPASGKRLWVCAVPLAILASGLVTRMRIKPVWIVLTAIVTTTIMMAILIITK